MAVDHCNLITQSLLLLLLIHKGSEIYYYSIKDLFRRSFTGAIPGIWALTSMAVVCRRRVVKYYENVAEICMLNVHYAIVDVIVKDTYLLPYPFQTLDLSLNWCTYVCNYGFLFL